jgi:hypothetical protein
VERNFPRAVQIVDWYHAVEYLSLIAEAVYGANSSNRPDCSFRFG